MLVLEISPRFRSAEMVTFVNGHPPLSVNFQMLILPGANYEGKRVVIKWPWWPARCLSAWCLSLHDRSPQLGASDSHRASCGGPAPPTPLDFQPRGDSEATATWHWNNPSASRNNKRNNYKQNSCLNQLCVFHPLTGVPSHDNPRKSLRT